ncbi:hypothetical protein BPSOL_0626 [Bifidobacterium pseudolongum]|nr:hypothetical protein BPSOL_0626 [Bifidobacterium pseudolongum]
MQGSQNVAGHRLIHVLPGSRVGPFACPYYSVMSDYAHKGVKQGHPRKRDGVLDTGFSARIPLTRVPTQDRGPSCKPYMPHPSMPPTRSPHSKSAMCRQWSCPQAGRVSPCTRPR